uniref:Uncharacterized protein n=1 Tax=Sphaerodactylus townsendi TaxID=933632 RepID=A0ACB8FS13_9SAUR
MFSSLPSRYLMKETSTLKGSRPEHHLGLHIADGLESNCSATVPCLTEMPGMVGWRNWGAVEGLLSCMCRRFSSAKRNRTRVTDGERASSGEA